MSDDFESWRKQTDDRLWLRSEPVMSEAEACRYYEAGLPPAAAVSRIIADRDREQNK